MHINAVITHTIHFLGLLTFYLGIKLPFEISWSGKKFGVGQPSIGAGRGSELGSWARFTTPLTLRQRHFLTFTFQMVYQTTPPSQLVPDATEI